MKSILDVFMNIHKDKKKYIISGGARGADSLAERYAKENNIEFVCFPADWKTHGKVAGFIRNKDIVKASDRVIAFYDGKSSGTKDTLAAAKRLDIPSYIVPF